MNVFFTNINPIVAAGEHCLVHQRKMIVEYAQLLSTAHFELDGNIVGYKPTHKNHPSAIWVRESTYHYQWVWMCATELCRLYHENTGKCHKTSSVLMELKEPPKNIPVAIFKQPPVAAPDQFKAIEVTDGSVVAYQKYLSWKFLEWKTRLKPMKVEFQKNVPSWLTEYRVFC
jgi:hypothetical protein